MYYRSEKKEIELYQLFELSEMLDQTDGKA